MKRTLAGPNTTSPSGTAQNRTLSRGAGRLGSEGALRCTAPGAAMQDGGKFEETSSSMSKRLAAVRRTCEKQQTPATT